MLYISGIHALNISCALDTDGDWHQAALRWDTINLLDSEQMLFKDYGIETNKAIPEHTQLYNVANHIRASLDMLELGQFAQLQDMSRFIGTDKYNAQIFEMVKQMSHLKHWESINAFMAKEYREAWTNQPKLSLDYIDYPDFYEPIINFVKFTNEQSSNYIVCKDTALMICYGLDRYVKEIHFDSTDYHSINSIIDKFCQKYNYTYTLKRDSKTCKIFEIHISHCKEPLLINISYQKAYINAADTCTLADIITYNINTICLSTITRIMIYEYPQDIYDLKYIVDNYYEQLDKTVKHSYELLPEIILRTIE